MHRQRQNKTFPNLLNSAVHSDIFNSIFFFSPPPFLFSFFCLFSVFRPSYAGHDPPEELNHLTDGSRPIVPNILCWREDFPLYPCLSPSL